MSALLAQLGVCRLPVPVPFPEAGGPANVYVIEDKGGGLALFDAGIGTPDGERAIREGFARIGRRLEEVRRIFVSHGHLDHYGFARAVQDASGAPVFAHARDHDKLTWKERSPERRALQAAYLSRLGAGKDLIALAARFDEHVAKMARPLEDVRELQPDQLLEFATFNAVVKHLPGHTPGLVCLWAEAPGVLFSDDHLLELVSPNPLIDLEGNAEPRHRALVEYLRSAVKARALPVKLVAPGHAEPFEGHAGVIDRLLAFYEKRQDKILQILQTAGEQSAAELAPRVFPRASPSQQYLILSEVVGNLEVLEERGKVRRDLSAGVYRFSANVTV